MNINMLNEFLAEEGEPSVREELLRAIEAYRMHGATGVRTFLYNRFNVAIDFEESVVRLQDDLTIGPEGEYALSIDEFASALQSNNMRSPSQSM